MTSVFSWQNCYPLPCFILYSKAKLACYSRYFPFPQSVNTNIRLVMFFAAKDEEALYSQQRQDLELAVAQIMNFLLQKLGLN